MIYRYGSCETFISAISVVSDKQTDQGLVTKIKRLWGTDAMAFLSFTIVLCKPGVMV